MPVREWEEVQEVSRRLIDAGQIRIVAHEEPDFTIGGDRK